MNIVCDKQLLSSAIDGVSRAVSPRSSIPALDGILFKADGFQLTLTGYDLEMAITTTIEANVREPGEIVLPAKLLGDMVRRLSGGEISIFTNDNGNATVKGGVAEFDILAISATDFPDLPNPGADRTFTMKAGELTDIIDKTLYAVSQDDRKPAHTGELFEIQEDNLTVVALDGYRLAIVKKAIEAVKHIRIIIPSKTLNEVNKLLGDPEQDVYISANRRFVVFETSEYMIMSRLIEGEFLNYANVIPEGYKTRAVIDTKDFIDTIERASLIITERLKNPLRILFSDRVTVRCQTNLGKVVDEFPAEIEGEQVEIGFNNRYLLDALRNSKQEKVVLEMSGALSPVKILPAEEESTNFIYLVLPVRFKND